MRVEVLLLVCERQFEPHPHWCRAAGGLVAIAKRKIVTTAKYSLTSQVV